jgi:hypothetical protein
MWPFRKKPAPVPYRWIVEAKCEQIVARAVEREAWRRLAPLMAAQRAAMGKAATQAAMNDPSRHQRQALLAAARPCPRCRQFHGVLGCGVLLGMMGTH